MPKIKIDTARGPSAGAAAGAGAVGLVAAVYTTGLLPPPNLALLAGVSPAVTIHLSTAMGALVVGTVLLVAPKGRTLHRTLGWSWVAMMATTAVSSLFIRDINGGAFSFIHFFSGWTLISLPMGVVFARRHQVALHRRTMTGIYLGGLLVAGAFTFLPGRLMWRIFFG